MSERETDAERAERIMKALGRGGVPDAITAPVTPDEIARQRAAAAMRLGAGAEKSESERWLAYWGTEEMNLRAQLALPPDEHHAEYRRRLADALTNLGRLDEAAEVAPERAAELERLKVLVEKADDLDCSCPDWVVAVEDPKLPGRVAYKLYPRYVGAGRIYSGRHDGVVEVTTCLRCGDANARASLPAGNLLAERVRLAADFPREGQGADYDALPTASAEQVAAARERGEI